MNKKLIALAALLSTGFTVACTSTESLIDDGDPDNPIGPGGDCLDGTGCEQLPGPGPTNPVSAQCAPGRDYLDFAGNKLTDGTSSIAGAKRWEEVTGVDRDRFKPFTALQTEYPRVLKAVDPNAQAPASLGQSASTFGAAPDRWYTEPQAGAIVVYSAYRIAFDGCLNLVTPVAKYDTAPDATSAAAECQTWTRKFWSRAATQAELDSCVKMATTDSAKEKNDLTQAMTDTTPERRWAYTCASVLSSAGFLTY